MKVLIDTSVWSQALRRQSSESLSTAHERVVNVLKELIHDSRIAMLGPVRQELLSGVKTQKQFEALQQIQLLDQVAWRRLKPYLSFVVLDNK